MDVLFIIAVFLLPFDNLFFAPSNGWATITPIMLFIYVLLNIKYLKNTIKKYKIVNIIYLIGLLFSLISYSIVGFEFSAFIDTIETLVLGYVILLSLDIYFIQKKNNIKTFLKALIAGYTISFIIGWIQFLSVKFNIDFMLNVFSSLAKRNYLHAGRIQYTFSEPSFISMHIFGVLLPVYLVSKNKKILYLIIAFTVSTILFGSSFRFVLDLIVILGIIFLTYSIKNKKKNFIIIFVALTAVFLVVVPAYNPRLKSAMENGIYSDPSLASRWFRINSSIKGYKYNILNFVIGYGYGNSIIPMRAGYNEALASYHNAYLTEVRLIGNSEYYSSNATFCLYTRLINDFGLIITCAIIYYIYKLVKKSKFTYKYYILLICAYLYLQFDSYAFYTIWLMIFLLDNNYINHKEKFVLEKQGEKNEDSTN